MDVDEDEEGSQHVRHIPDYGIEVDFDSLDDEEREVCIYRCKLRPRLTRKYRMVLWKRWQISIRRYQRLTLR